MSWIAEGRAESCAWHRWSGNLPPRRRPTPPRSMRWRRGSASRRAPASRDHLAVGDDQGAKFTVRVLPTRKARAGAADVEIGAVGARRSVERDYSIQLWLRRRWRRRPSVAGDAQGGVPHRRRLSGTVLRPTDRYPRKQLIDRQRADGEIVGHHNRGAQGQRRRIADSRDNQQIIRRPDRRGPERQARPARPVRGGVPPAVDPVQP